MNTSPWFMIVLVWPSAVIGAVLQLVGIASRKVWVSVVGVLFSLGLLSYLMMNPPPTRWLGLIALVGIVLGVVALRRNERIASAMLVAPYLFLLVQGFLRD